MQEFKQTFIAFICTLGALAALVLLYAIATGGL
jgi:hypothetical protein